MANPRSQGQEPPEDELDTAQEILGGFPRHLTQQMIAQRGRRSAARSGGGVLALGLGLTLLALAFPDESLSRRELAILDSEPGARFTPFRGLVSLVHTLGPWSFEQAAFLLSAMLHGACLPLMVRLGKIVGVSRGVATGVALAILLTPAGWDAATSPGPLALELFVATGLFAALWKLRERDDGRARLTAGAWGLGLVAVMIEPVRGGRLALPDLQETLWALGGLGPAWVCIAALVLHPREESEERPPKWLLAFGLAPWALGWIAHMGGEPQVIHLLPLAALGGFDLFGRRADELVGWELPATVLATVALTALVLPLRPDPLQAWRESARRVLDPTDILITTDRDHAYLARERWRLDTWSSPPELLHAFREEAQEAVDRGQRVVLDLDPGEESPWEGVLSLGQLEEDLSVSR